MLKLSRNEGKNTVVKINRKETKEVDQFVYLGSVEEKNGRIQNKINERGKALKCYHLSKSILWNRSQGSSVSIQSDYGLDDWG
jgi:hypothetical protein